ncbi:unnamed protein product [Pedinophyceae sp. YPF-701]|nr:unnamed protein product [Pedinophyceae sp. YPF-701]
MSHYAALQVPETASADEIRRAFQDIALRCHPDKAGADEDVAARFLSAQAAYEVLRDADRRAAYDKELRSERRREDVAVSDELDLDEMDEAVEGGAAVWRSPCRCGDCFEVAESDLQPDASNLLVQCGSCSLYVRIHYTVA